MTLNVLEALVRPYGNLLITNRLDYFPSFRYSGLVLAFINVEFLPFGYLVDKMVCFKMLIL